MKKSFAGIISALLALSLCICCFTSCEQKNQEYVRNIFAFDTYITLRIYETDGLNSDIEICDSVANMLSELEKKLSYSNPDSVISQINNEAYKNPVKTEESLYWLIRNSVDLCELTYGAFDITLGKISEAWGFFKENPSKPDFSHIEKLAGKQNYKNIVFNDREYTISFNNDSFSIDLGAIAKGYALDMINTLMINSGVISAVVDFGGSIMILSGDDSEKVKIGVSDGKGNIVGNLQLPDAYISTSNAENRFVEFDNIRYHHIIDSSTGYPSDSDIASCTAISENGSISDAMSTAAFVMGKDKLMELYNKYEICEFVIITKDGTVTVTDGIKNSFTAVDGAKS